MFHKESEPVGNIRDRFVEIMSEVLRFISHIRIKSSIFDAGISLA